MTPRIVLADDHVMVRQGLKTLLTAEQDFQIVAEAASGVELVAAAKQHRPDLVIADIAMPYGNGLEVVGEIARWSPDTRTILLTGLVSRGLLTQAVSGKVAGVFLKSDPPDVFLDGVKTVLGGGHVVSEQAKRLSEAGNHFASLSERELQVLHGLAAGQSNAELGQKLGISAKTVEKHRTSLMRKLEVNSLAQVLSVALREGLLDTSKMV
ncbi:MAG: response regulator transcription factor [Pseudomonadota bacterium]